MTTRTDVSTWVANTNPNGYQAAPLDEGLHDKLVDALVAGDRPDWGEDWSEYLEAFDYQSITG